MTVRNFYRVAPTIASNSVIFLVAWARSTMSYSALPEELWTRILEIGIQNSSNNNIEKSSPILNYKDLCCLSISCRRLNRLSNDESLWSSLLSSDFPQFHNHSITTPPIHFSSSSSGNISNSSPISSSKSLYKIRFERDKARKLAAHRRAVLRIESQIAEQSRKLQEIQLRAAEETEKLKTAVTELSNLRKARQASVALNVWQPEVIRGRHKQIVEQCAVPADSRIHALEMEVRLCKQQLAGLDKAYRDEKKRLDAAKEQLGSIKYHPLRDYTSPSGRVDECGIKRKKLKKDNINWAATRVQEERKQ